MPRHAAVTRQPSLLFAPLMIFTLVAALRRYVDDALALCFYAARALQQHAWRAADAMIFHAAITPLIRH